MEMRHELAFEGEGQFGKVGYQITSHYGQDIGVRSESELFTQE